MSDGVRAGVEKRRIKFEAERELKEWTVYVLQNTDNLKTYCGVTKDLLNRLLQHNGLKKGGAWFS